MKEVDPIVLSLTLAFSTSIILFFLGNIIAYWIYFSKGLLSIFLRILANLPLVLPPTVMGFYFLLLFSPNSVVGGILGEIGLTMVFSFQGLILASVIFGIPFMVNPLISSMESMPSSFVELGMVARRSRPFIFRKLLFPHLSEGLVAGFMMSFAHTLGEFGLILMIGGNIPGQTRVASIEIYNRVLAMDYSQANQLSLIMVLISIFTLGIVFYWFKSKRPKVVW